MSTNLHWSLGAVGHNFTEDTMGCGCRKPTKTRKDQDPLDRYAFLTPAQIRAKKDREDSKDKKDKEGK